MIYSSLTVLVVYLGVTMAHIFLLLEIIRIDSSVLMLMNLVWNLVSMLICKFYLVCACLMTIVSLLYVVKEDNSLYTIPPLLCNVFVSLTFNVRLCLIILLPNCYLRVFQMRFFALICSVEVLYKVTKLIVWVVSIVLRCVSMALLAEWYLPLVLTDA